MRRYDNLDVSSIPRLHTLPHATSHALDRAFTLEYRKERAENTERIQVE